MGRKSIEDEVAELLECKKYWYDQLDDHQKAVANRARESMDSDSQPYRMASKMIEKWGLDASAATIVRWLKGR